MFNLVKLAFIGTLYYGAAGWEQCSVSDFPFPSIRDGIKNTLNDEFHRKQIRLHEPRGMVSPPSPAEEEYIAELAHLEKKGAVIPDFFQIWKKALRQEAITSEDLEKISQLTPEEQDILYELFFRYDSYRDIHQKPLTPVESTDYVINVLWLEQYPDRERSEKLEDRFTSVVERWREGNSCDFNIWYHPSLIPPNVLEESEKLLSNDTAVKFRVLSSIDIDKFISMNDFFFTWQEIPHFLKIDASKALTIQQTLGEEKQFKYSVFVDFDIKAQAKDDLFDQRTITHLERSGFVMGLPGPGGPTDGYENNFMIFDRDYPDLLKTHQIILKKTLRRKLQQLETHLAKGTLPDQAAKKAIIQGVYSMYLQIHNQQLLQTENLSADEFQERAILPPAKPIASPPTKYDWV